MQKNCLEIPFSNSSSVIIIRGLHAAESTIKTNTRKKKTLRIWFYLYILWHIFTFHPRNMRSCMRFWLKPERHQPPNDNNTSLNKRFLCAIYCLIGFSIFLNHCVVWLWSHLWYICKEVQHFKIHAERKLRVRNLKTITNTWWTFRDSVFLTFAVVRIIPKFAWMAMIQIIPKQQFICDSFYRHWRTIVNHILIPNPLGKQMQFRSNALHFLMQP